MEGEKANKKKKNDNKKLNNKKEETKIKKEETEIKKEVKDEKESKLNKLSFLKKKEIWIPAIIGFIIGALIILALALFGVIGNRNGTIATVDTGKVTENELYEYMKSYFPVSYVLELVDEKILTPLYELTDDQIDEINTQADEIISMYELYYGYTEEEFLSENGFETKDDFIAYLQLDYRRDLYCLDYFKTLLSEDEIESYYEENVYGEIVTKHILVEISDDVTDEEALEIANEIIAKLDDGESFDDVASEYEDSTINEEVTFDSFDASSIAEEYVEASKELEVGSYTTEAVLTDYGYHIIYCVSKEDKPSFEEVENDIVEILAEDLEEDDVYIRYKALAKMRDDYGLVFNDSRYEEEYAEYCEYIGYTPEEEETDTETETETDDTTNSTDENTVTVDTEESEE